MTELFIDPNKTNIGVRVYNLSDKHSAVFTINVFQSDKNTICETHNGNLSYTQKNPSEILLNNSPSDYKGCYIRGEFTIGSGINQDEIEYYFQFSIIEQGKTIDPIITLRGNTTNGVDHRMPSFHIN